MIVAIAMKMRHDSEKVFFDLMAEAGFNETAMLEWPLPGDWNRERRKFICMCIDITTSSLLNDMARTASEDEANARGSRRVGAK